MTASSLFSDSPWGGSHGKTLSTVPFISLSYIKIKQCTVWGTLTTKSTQLGMKLRRQIKNYYAVYAGRVAVPMNLRTHAGTFQQVLRSCLPQERCYTVLVDRRRQAGNADSAMICLESLGSGSPVMGRASDTRHTSVPSLSLFLASLWEPRRHRVTSRYQRLRRPQLS